MPPHPNRSKKRDNPARNPLPAEIKAEREAAGLTQAQAGALVYSSMRAWQDWEAGARRMHPVFWLFFKGRVSAGDHLSA